MRWNRNWKTKAISQTKNQMVLVSLGLKTTKDPGVGPKWTPQKSLEPLAIEGKM